MLALSRRTVIATSMLAAVGIAVPATLAATGGGGTPANKAVAAGSTIQDVAPTSTGTQIMSATFKTSKPEDLLMSVSLECSIITDVMVPGTTTPNGTSSGEAAGAIKVWLTIEGDNQPTPIIVPITDTSTPPQDPSAQRAGTEADKVTFCDRDHKVSVTDKENAPDGTDALEEYQFTKTANDFNWVRLNAGSGMHVVRVWAQFVPKDVSDAQNATATTTSGSSAHGFVGNRTLIIEPTKLANNAVIADNGTSTSG
jgi:hypothetical protein